MFEGLKVALVDDDPAVRSSLAQSLELAGFDVLVFGAAEAALASLAQGFEGVLVTDVRLPRMDGLTLLQQALAQDPGLPVILITAHGDVSMAVGAMRVGAYDFIEKPFAPERLVEVTTRALEKRSLSVEVQSLRRQLAGQRSIESTLLGRSPAILTLRRQVQQLADTDADVMLVGETGTGKELVARCLHDHSVRRHRHFVAINCGGLPETLLESELFGHEVGAFTSASKRRVGKIEHAQGGTLLLDEIESMPLGFQVKLLRVLQERRLERLGSNEEVDIDVRVVAATKGDLREMSDRGLFRADLYYRLNVAVLRLPPLRERREDVPLLFDHFLLQASARHGRRAAPPSPALLQQLMSHDWPGNVRELRNAAERYVLGLGADQLLDAPADVPPGLARRMDQVEKVLIEQALRQQGGNVSATCESLGIGRKTLYDKLARHGIQPDDFR